MDPPHKYQLWIPARPMPRAENFQRVVPEAWGSEQAAPRGSCSASSIPTVEPTDDMEEFRRKYPGRPYHDMENTRFADILRTEKIGVVRSGYFKRCLGQPSRLCRSQKYDKYPKAMPFQDRVNIPREEFISGDEVMAQWKQHGAYFLVIFSYSWIVVSCVLRVLEYGFAAELFI